jgi:hypothetical protein
LLAYDKYGSLFLLPALCLTHDIQNPPYYQSDTTTHSHDVVEIPCPTILPWSLIYDLSSAAVERGGAPIASCAPSFSWRRRIVVGVVRVLQGKTTRATHSATTIVATKLPGEMNIVTTTTSTPTATAIAATAAPLRDMIHDEHHSEESSKRTLLLNRKKEIQTRLKELDNSAKLVRPGDVANVVAPPEAGGGSGDGGIAAGMVLSVEDTNNDTTTTMLASLPDVTRPRFTSSIMTTTSTTSSSVPSTAATSATPSSSSSSTYDVTPRTDVHWDYALKEMAWLSADFKSERKRQTSLAKKLSNAILQYFATLTIKKTRERAQNEARVRRLASKMARNVRNEYWKKMERVVEYKQRVVCEQGRRTEMDKRLIFLVKQTERYGECLLTTTATATPTTNNSNDDD